jgi:hypothetical protein
MALQYRREGEGFVLYSLGPNGQDDGGRTSWQDGRQVADNVDTSAWDDVRLRIPPMQK